MTIIPEIPMRRIMREAPRLFTDTFLKVPELIVAKSKVITVIPGSAACAEPVEVDGEVVGKAPVRFEVLDNQINVVVKA
jgi:diacylglycerol kinase family enzyme